jgi:hypothetical protein
MDETTTMQPWDEKPMRVALLSLVTQLPRVRLDELRDAPSAPGVYLQFLASKRVEPVLGTLIATGRYPLYAGVSGASLRERIGRYRQSLSGMDVLSERDLYVSVLPCVSKASAQFSESVLLDELAPPFQGLGWGSKVPGSHRREQSPIDAILPGRRWASPTGPRLRAITHLRVLSSLIRLDPVGPRWEPLIRSNSQA